MRTERVKKGDLAIRVHNRDGMYQLHAQPSEVAPDVMQRIGDHLDQLMPWIARIGKPDWNLPPYPQPLNADSATLLAPKDSNTPEATPETGVSRG